MGQYEERLPLQQPSLEQQPEHPSLEHPSLEYPAPEHPAPEHPSLESPALDNLDHLAFDHPTLDHPPLGLSAEPPPIERRINGDRRFHERRQQERRVQDRRQQDRRVLSIQQRLRIGLWKTYAWRHEIGQDALLPRSGYYFQRLRDDLAPEVCRYRFFNLLDDREVSYDQVLEASIEAVLTELGRCDRKAVYVIEEIAEIMAANYRLVAIDRRTTERRTAERRTAERRDEHRRQADKQNRLN